MTNERIEWMDAFRGIGMICVILGHMQIPHVLSHVVFSFHMPLFFFASGYLYSGGWGGKWILKKVDSLLLPYLVYGVVGLVVRQLNAGDVNWWFVKMLFCGNGVGVVWFLTCLFMVELIGAAVVRIKRTILIMVVASLMAVVGYWMEHNGHFPVMMSRVVLQACVFWLVGYLFRRHSVFNRFMSRPCNKLKNWAILVLLLAGCALFKLQRVDFGSMKTGNPILLYTTAMSFIVLIALVSQSALGRMGILKFIGRNSLLFMNWHVIIPSLTLCALSVFGLDANSSVMLKCGQRVANIAILFGLVWWLSRYANVLTGRARVFSRLVKQ